MLFEQQSTALQIDGPVGKLEVVIEKPIASDVSIVAIICHPHPQHGGTMTNKVVTTIARALQRLGIWTVRFNFRGVGQSEGVYDDAKGEVEDLRAVVNWVQEKFPNNYRLWLGGFSFGSYIAAKLATEIPVDQLILIAPPVHHYYFKSLPEFTVPWLVVQGEADEVVPPTEVFKWVEQRKNKPRLIRLPGVTHFFHGELIALRNLLEENLSPFK